MLSRHPPAPANRIVTPRLVLRCWEPRDAPLSKTAVDASIDHLRPWMPWVHDHPAPIQKHIERMRTNRGNFDLGVDFVFAVFDREEQNVLGGTGLHMRLGEGAREIGYWVHAAHTGRGLATELSAALTKIGFVVEGLDRMEIHCDPANTRSAAVPRKLGYTLDATLRRRSQTPDGKPRDTMIWSMLHDEFASSPAAGIEIEAFDACGERIEV
jgi:RimJ/RimL family protein N-acetyltransferase